MQCQILLFDFYFAFVFSFQLKVLDGKNDRLYQFDGILPETASNKEVSQSFVYSPFTIITGSRNLGQLPRYDQFFLSDS